MVTFVSPIPLRVISAFDSGSPMLEHEVNAYANFKDLGGMRREELYRRAMISASSGWLVPTMNRPINPRTDCRAISRTRKDFDPTAIQHVPF